jgi:hypothetical protein
VVGVSNSGYRPTVLVSGQSNIRVHVCAPGPVGLLSLVSFVGCCGLSIRIVTWPAFVRRSIQFGTSSHPPVI